MSAAPTAAALLSSPVARISASGIVSTDMRFLVRICSARGLLSTGVTPRFAGIKSLRLVRNMPDQESRTWTFIDTVSVSPSMVSSVDSVVILTNADNPFSPLHGGWISDVDRARASAVTLAQAARIRLRPAVSNHQFRLVAPRPQQRADGDVPEVQGVRLPAPGSPAAARSKFGYSGPECNCSPTHETGLPASKQRRSSAHFAPPVALASTPVQQASPNRSSLSH